MKIKQEPLWTSNELALTLGQPFRNPWFIDGVHVDSREILPGDLFIALSGSSLDGHDFLGDAFANGAVASLVTSSQIDEDMPSRQLMQCDDSYDALVKLAKYARDRAPAKVIGVTGSVGKTSIVNALRQALTPVAPTHCSVRSYNNHVGVPLSLVRMPRDSRFGIFELGMSRCGEINERAKLVRPDVAVITTVGPAHLKSFDDVEGIARTKAEILHHMAPDGVAIIGIDHDYADILTGIADDLGRQYMTVSATNKKADIYPSKVERIEGETHVTAQIGQKVISYKMSIAGDEWVLNSLLLLAACNAVGVEPGQAALALESIEIEPGRGRVHQLDFDGTNVTLLDESYNANPVSMRAALRRFAVLDKSSLNSRRIAILGDMQELGPDSEKYHLALEPLVRAADVDVIYAVGEQMTKLAATCGVEIHATETFSGFCDGLLPTLKDGDQIFIKGSNSAGLSIIAQRLIARSGVKKNVISMPADTGQVVNK